MRAAWAWLCLMIAGLSACAPEPWKPAFIAEDPRPAALADDAPVAVREVPWARVQKTLGELEAEIAAADAPPSEWPAEKRTASRAALLRGLQVTADPGEVLIVGRSQFRTTAEVSPGGEALARFARGLGANLVVWSRAFVGRAASVRQELITEHRSATWWTPQRRGEPSRPGYYTETSTTSIPVPVEEDEWAWVMVFLRAPEPGS